MDLHSQSVQGLNDEVLVTQVLFERLFHAYRFSQRSFLDRRFLYSVGNCPQPDTSTPKPIGEVFRRNLPKLTDSGNTLGIQELGRFLPYPTDLFHLKRCKEVLYLFGQYYRQSVWFLKI